MPVPGGGFDQAYNAQAAVDTDSLLVVAPAVTQATNDKQQVVPMIEQLRAEVADTKLPDLLPLALREATAPLSVQSSLDDALDAIVTPVRTGVVLTQRDLHAGARSAGVGFRRGERRYALRAMMQQDAAATMRWLLGHARAWVEVHDRSGEDSTSQWWQDRARHTVRTLEEMLDHEATSSTDQFGATQQEER